MNAAERPWLDAALAPRERAEKLVAAMTLEQKIAQLHGNMATIDIYGLADRATTAEEMEQLAAQIRVERHVAAIDELGIPRFRITNGPVGLGQNDCVSTRVYDEVKAGTKSFTAAYTHPSSAKATALPSALGAAASFDPAVATAYGEVIGDEMNKLALHVFDLQDEAFWLDTIRTRYEQPLIEIFDPEAGHGKTA